MKVSVDFDMTPDEARRLMGLPDLAPLQAKMLEQLEKQMMQNLSFIDPETLSKALLPMGGQGLEQMQTLMWDIAAQAMGGDAKKSRKQGG